MTLKNFSYQKLLILNDMAKVGNISFNGLVIMPKTITGSALSEVLDVQFELKIV